MAKEPEQTNEADENKKVRREIPGNLTYTTTPGTLKTALDAILRTERPDRVTQDFVADVLGVKGGSGKAALPIMKRIGLVSQDGTPTEIYARFKTDGGRSAATIEALRKGFQEIYRRREYAHKVSDKDLMDTIVEITGLQATDPIAKAIHSTFKSISSFITDKDAVSKPSEKAPPEPASMQKPPPEESGEIIKYGLSYQINIVLPETNNIDVFNAIFRSLRENLLR